MNLSIVGLKNIPYLKEGENLEKFIAESIKDSDFSIEDNNVLCIASKNCVYFRKSSFVFETGSSE